MSKTWKDIAAKCDAYEKKPQGKGYTLAQLKKIEQGKDPGPVSPSSWAKSKPRSDGPFQKVEAAVAKEGARDPAAVAAAIGRKELGQAEMTRRSVEGRK